MENYSKLNDKIVQQKLSKTRGKKMTGPGNNSNKCIF
jgi:hypothetical protein